MNTNSNASHYDVNFYKGQKDISKQSAEEIVPMLSNMFQPKSIADVGCGVGTWLAVWERMGINDLLGIDGDYVDRNQLQIDKNDFFPFDLTTELSLEKKYDLVTSFEVGEHIPQEFADTFVKNICSLSNIVVFSAALPGQGGTNHINEQWPHFWAGHFKNNGFIAVDCLRHKIWNNEKIGYYYRQNIIVYIHESIYNQFETLNINSNDTDQNIPLPLVHPQTLQKAINRAANLEQKLNESRTDFRAAYKNFKKSFKDKLFEKLNINR